MVASLHVLVVEDRPDTVRFLLEFLLSQQHRLEKCNGRQAINTITSARKSGVPFDLALIGMAQDGTDGMVLLRELRARKDETRVAIYIPFSEVTPAMFQEADSLECMFLDKPLELRRVEQLLEDLTRKGARPGGGGGGGGNGGGTGSGAHAKDKDQPFFGTARVARPVASSDSSHYFSNDAHETKAPAQPPAAGGAALTAGLRRTPLPIAPQPQNRVGGNDFFPDDNAAGGPPISNTARIRRSVAGNFAEAPASNDLGGTARIRRSVTGSIRADQVGAGAAKASSPEAQQAPMTHAERRVLCASCRREFSVSVKPQSFNAPCVHCGQLNRIDPIR